MTRQTLLVGRARRVDYVAGVLDSLAWAVAVFCGLALTLDVLPGARDVLLLGALVLLAVVAQCLAGFRLGLYSVRFVSGSFSELKTLVATLALTALLLIVTAAVVGLGRVVFVVTVAAALPFAVVLMFAIRYFRRLRWEADSRPGESAKLTLVFGAGYLGRHVVRVMLTDRTSLYRPVGFLDDDESLRGATIEGVSVLGRLEDLCGVARDTGAEVVVVCVARANGGLLRRVSEMSGELGLRVLVFPSLEEVLEGKSRLRDVREISVEDLIGRQPINTDVESMAGYLRGKRILVTGAGGSIGSELCRQISKYAPGELILLDRDESGLQSTQLLLEGNGLLTSRNIVLADIRDSEALDGLFRSLKPSVVFHAAALKHLPMLERFPDEAWKTNVIGTLNVLKASQSVGVETFVNISTDKAANATSVLGHSKRLAERLTAGAAAATGKRYLSVRFGNVLGSRGSLVPVFAAMIEAGGPVTVTDREVTRFFMSIAEACHLVVQAGGIGRPGEILILDMGEPVRILDIAELMIARSGRDIGIVFTGLREGEKLHEELVSEGETVSSPVHPKISHSTVHPLTEEELDLADWKRTIIARDS